MVQKTKYFSRESKKRIGVGAAGGVGAAVDAVSARRVRGTARRVRGSRNICKQGLFL